MRGHRGFLLEVQSHAGMFSACVGGSKRGERAEGKKARKRGKEREPLLPSLFPFFPLPLSTPATQARMFSPRAANPT